MHIILHEVKDGVTVSQYFYENCTHQIACLNGIEQTYFMTFCFLYYSSSCIKAFYSEQHKDCQAAEKFPESSGRLSSAGARIGLIG